MISQKKFIVSHAPFWHNGSSVAERNCNIIAAALPAVLFGFFQYGMPAVGVVSLSIASAIFWEFLYNKVTKMPDTVGDGHAAMLGLVFSMLLPASMPWWAVITGTLLVIVIGKHIFGGIGASPFNPAVLALAILGVSWGHLLDFDGALVDYQFGFATAYPMAALKNFGVSAIEPFSTCNLLLGKQIGGLGSTFGLGLIAGGLYLIARGIIRWEICFSFLAGVFVTAMLFSIADPTRYAGPFFHLFAGYTLIGAFFLATEDASSPVNFIPMLIYGAGAGFLAVLIRNIGVYSDGVIYAILVANLVNPLLDKIRPKALGKVV